MPRLADLYAELGTDYELSLDLNDPAAGDAPVLDVAAGAGAPTGCGCAPRGRRSLRSWARSATDVHLVHSTRRSGSLDVPVERHAAQLAEAGIDAINMHHTEWTAGLVALFHRFDVLAFAWDVAGGPPHPRSCSRSASTGCTPTTSTAWSRPSPSGRCSGRPPTTGSRAAGRPDAHEDAADDARLLDRAVDTRVRRAAAVVAHHEAPCPAGTLHPPSGLLGPTGSQTSSAVGVGDVGMPAGTDRGRALREVALVEQPAVDADPVGLALRDRLAREPDDPLHEVLDAGAVPLGVRLASNTTMSPRFTSCRS